MRFLKANPPVECEEFVLVDWLSEGSMDKVSLTPTHPTTRGNGWYRLCDGNPPYN